MFDTWYPFRYINYQVAINELPLIRRYSYSFSTRKRRYLVSIHEYEYKVFVIKFHDASHKKQSNRYNLVFNDFEKPSKIIRTVIEIALHLLKKEQMASFAFVGVPKENKEDKLQSNAQRLRIYKRLAEDFLGVQTFLHGVEFQSNCYLLVNRKNANPEVLYGTIIEMFAKEFNEINIF